MNPSDTLSSAADFEPENGASPPAVVPPDMALLDDPVPLAGAEGVDAALERSLSLARYPLGGMRVMVVGRPGWTRERLHQLAMALGAAQVVHATDGQDAIETLEMQSVHLIFSDYTFDDGTTAQHMLERLRMKRLLPVVTAVVIVAAERSARRVAAIADFGADAYIVKPFDPTDLTLRLARIGHRKRLLYGLHDALDQGDLERAADEVAALDQISPEAADEAMRVLTERLIDEERLDEAERLVMQAMRRTAPGWARLRIAQIRMRQNRLDEVEVLTEALCRDHPWMLAAYELLATARQARGDSRAALDCLDEASLLAEPSVQRLRTIGRLATQNGELARAEQAFDHLFRVDPAGRLRTHDDDLSLLQVLVARGRNGRARRMEREQTRRLAGHPDANLVTTLTQRREAIASGDRMELPLLHHELALAVETDAQHLTIGLALQALEACVDDGARVEAMRIAQAIRGSRRAERATLDRIQQSLALLQLMPAGLIPVADLPVTIERLGADRGNDALGELILTSLAYWELRKPSDAAIAAARARLNEVTQPGA